MEEENPFLVKKKPKKKEEPQKETNIDEISFMVDPSEKKKEDSDKPQRITEAPRYEKAGTPIWDKKDVKDIHNPDYEVVESKEEEEE